MTLTRDILHCDKSIFHMVSKVVSFFISVQNYFYSKFSTSCSHLLNSTLLRVIFRVPGPTQLAQNVLHHLVRMAAPKFLLLDPSLGTVPPNTGELLEYLGALFSSLDRQSRQSAAALDAVGDWGRTEIRLPWFAQSGPSQVPAVVLLGPGGGPRPTDDRSKAR